MTVLDIIALIVLFVLPALWLLTIDLTGAIGRSNNQSSQSAG